VSGECRFRDDAGPWVLGALGEPDASAFSAHLAACDGCRREVAELQVVADVLPMAAPQVLPPAEVKAGIMGVVTADAERLRAAGDEADRTAATRDRRRVFGWPRRLRPLPAAVLATALLAIGVAAGVLLAGGDGTRTVTGFGPKGAEIALRMTDQHGELDLDRMPAPPSGRVYQVWLVTARNRPLPTHALFTVAADGRARVDIPESLKGAVRVLVTAEPPGGSTQPTSPPIAGARLS
jgi:hypothetical protein